MFKKQQAIVYTDGSCHTQRRIGAWAAVIFVNHSKLIITGIEQDTTHNRMEITAVIASINYLEANLIAFDEFICYTDSQYVAGLQMRKQHLQQTGLRSKNGKLNQNADLLEQFFLLMEKYQLLFKKVKAHQHKTAIVNYNIEADMLVRKTLRESLL